MFFELVPVSTWRTPKFMSTYVKTYTLLGANLKPWNTFFTEHIRVLKRFYINIWLGPKYDSVGFLFMSWHVITCCKLSSCSCHDICLLFTSSLLVHVMACVYLLQAFDLLISWHAFACCKLSSCGFRGKFYSVRKITGCH